MLQCSVEILQRNGETVMRFGCSLCDCPSVSVPSELHADALVTCSNCGEAIATWLEFKGCVTRVIASEPYYAPGALSRASYDPLSAEALSNEAQVV